MTPPGESMRPKRLILGMAAVLPLLYFAAFFLVIFPIFIAEIRADAEVGDPSGFVIRLAVVAILHVSIAILALSLLVYFLILLYRVDGLDSARKTIWALALLFGNVLVFPMFYYAFFWEDPPVGSAN
jgi:hypothetical protein